ncbi:MAG: protein translocase subunit SecD [Micrococcales bacterium]
MATSGIVKAARKKLIWLGAILAIFCGLIGLGIAFPSNDGRVASFVPQLALDLQGGTQIILTPQLDSGADVSAEQLQQAVAIIRQRVDSTGVSEAQINTSGNNIVVSIPGKPDDNTLKLIQSSAKLQFRPVLFTSQSTTSTISDGSATASPTPTVPATPTSAPLATGSASPTDPSDLNWVSPALQAQFENLDCSKQFREPGQVDDPALPLVTCDNSLSYKYILGPVEVEGADISNASAGTGTTSTGASTGQWLVDLTFNDQGTKQFSASTQRLFTLTAPRNQFAVTLDGYAITAPAVQAVITNGRAQISGSFDAASAKSLADQLKYGSLPIGFNVQSQENISATLGSSQLTGGLLAGLIGLALVVLYSIFQYRGLAVVTLGSLVIAGIATYLLVSILSWRQGYRLSLSGIAGLIVSIGITADSFIVYFERVRDELRDGRQLSAAVDAGWSRAIRTILVSDGINILAAGTLFVLTVGNVKGFAYTLGLTTLIDVAVVMLFTHPMLQLLAQTRFFASGHKFSGFDVKNQNASSYLGRGQFRVSSSVAVTKVAKASGEAARRQTIAERKAAEKGDN